MERGGRVLVEVENMNRFFKKGLGGWVTEIVD